MKEGTCHLCGTFGPLTFEHVPPRAAFNDQRIFEADIQTVLGGAWIPGQSIKEGRYQQRGAGKYTLCAQCNNDTGSWYGNTYVDFARQAAYLVRASGGTLTLAYPYSIKPLRVLKQIVVMFFSACGPGLQAKQPDLVRFALNKEVTSFPTSIGIYAYLYHPTLSTSIRQSGLSGVIIGTRTCVISEIAFPPFGFVLTVDSRPFESTLLDVRSIFAQYEFHDRRTVYLKLPVLPVVSVFPGDFRTIEEIQRDGTEGKKIGSIHFP